MLFRSTLDTAAHEGAEQVIGMVIKGMAQHSGQGESGVSIDDAFMEPVTDLADKVVDIDFGAAQTQRRLTAHGDNMAALSTVEAAILGISDLFGVATAEHLVDEFIIVDAIITRVVSLESFPMIMKDLFENTPTWYCVCFHEGYYISS